MEWGWTGDTRFDLLHAQHMPLLPDRASESARIPTYRDSKESTVFGAVCERVFTQ